MCGFFARPTARRFRGFGLYLSWAKHLKHGLHSPYWWLRCAVGVNNNKNLLVRGYKKLLEVEILQNPLPLRVLSALADPLMGEKSIVMYFDKLKRNRAAMSILTDGYFDGARDIILALQNPTALSLWFKNGVIDPWNHLEAAMGLNLIGERSAAEHAIAFLRNSQAPDGSWFRAIGSAVPIDETLHQFTMQGKDRAQNPRHQFHCLHRHRDLASL